MTNNRNDLERSRSNGSLDQEPGFQDYLQIILRGKWWILLVFAVVFVATVAYTFLSKPVYEASTSVLIDTKGQQQETGMMLFDVAGLGAQKNIKNEIEILKSYALAENAAKLLLEKKYTDESKSQPILIIKPPDDSAQVRAYATPREIVARLQKAVDFDPVRDADVIKITARSNQATEAALLANTYADAYYDRNLLASRTRSRSVREFLQDQLKTRQTALTGAEDSLQQYMEKEGIVSLDDESKKVIDQLSQLEAQRDAQDIEIQSLSKTLSSYQEELAKVEPNVSQVIGEANDPYIRLLQEQIAQLEVKKDVTVAQNPTITGQTIYTDKMKEIDDQIVALRKKLQDRTNEYLKSLIPSFMPSGSGASRASDPSIYLSGLKAKVVELKIEEQSLVVKKNALSDVIKQYERSFEQIPQKSIEYARRERNRLSSEKLYLLVEEKYNEAAIKEKSEFGYVDIIDPAIVPLAPVSPKVRLNLLLGVILGLGLGVGFVFVREYVDVRVRTPEDLKKRGYSILTAVALMDDEIRKLGGKTKVDRNGKLVDAHLLSFLNPLSSIAEAYRRLRTNILYGQLDRPAGLILVTSPNPGEGKSTTVSNLAITFAQAGKKVILLDTDLRKPGLHDEFSVEQSPGLTELLHQNAAFKSVVRHTAVENLDLICCGAIPPNPSETLGSQKMKDFLHDLKRQYDIVLFDSPPVLAVTDPAILATLADAVVMVVSSGQTRVDALERSDEIIREVGSKTLGLVLNNFDLRRAYGGYYGYYRNKYYTYGYGATYGAGNGEEGKKVGGEKAKSEGDAKAKG
jgi:capsular exopolysaccharide synthesis family protein